MKVWELSVKVYLKKDIGIKERSKALSHLVTKTICSSEEFVSYHKGKDYKQYNFDFFYPIEKDVYKKGNTYSFRIRTISKELKNHINNSILEIDTAEMTVLSCSQRFIEKKTLERVFSLTPAVIKTDNGYWRNGVMNILEYEKRLTDNLIKKYKFFTDNEIIDEDIVLFKNIEINNRKPIATNYKDITLLGDKVTIYPSDHSIAQDILYMSLGTGLGENNTYGFGFLSYRYL